MFSSPAWRGDESETALVEPLSLPRELLFRREPVSVNREKSGPALTQNSNRRASSEARRPIYIFALDTSPVAWRYAG